MSDDELKKIYERRYGPFVHMSEPEKAIWLRYLQQGGLVNAPFLYDIRVGDGVPMPPDSHQFDLNAAYALTTKRIDVLYQKGNIYTIVEVKRRAGAGAIGQMLLYRELFDTQQNISSPSQMLLVTDQLQPDMKTALVTNNITFYEVGL